MPDTSQQQGQVQPELPLAQITISRAHRQRREVKTNDLKDSIKSKGLIQPIVVRTSETPGMYELVAGERRLESCRELGWTRIPVVFLADMSPVDQQIIELEENLKRSELEWQDQAGAVARIHQLFVSKDPEWTMSDTAQECSMAKSDVSMFLRVHNALASNGRVADAGSMRGAYNVLTRMDQRAAGDALQELLDDDLPATSPPASPQAPLQTISGASLPGLRVALPLPASPPPEIILEESFLDWAPLYRGPKFNLIHCDFPYGIDLFNGEQGRGAEPSKGYADGKDVYEKLLVCLCRNLDRLMSVSGHLMFWYSAKHTKLTEGLFAELAPSLTFAPYPLVWMKSDNAGIAADFRHGPRHVYETCLLASRGSRQIVKVMADAYSCPTDKRLHPSTKPEPMLKHFMTMLVDDASQVLDPTCGSGASLRAADGLGAARVLGLEIDPMYVGPARLEFKARRRLRNAALMTDL